MSQQKGACTASWVICNWSGRSDGINSGLSDHNNE
jgi:hypothetical protein